MSYKTIDYDLIEREMRGNDNCSKASDSSCSATSRDYVVILI